MSSLARNILDDLQTLVAQLEGDLGFKFDDQNDILARVDIDSFVHQDQECFDQDQDQDKDQDEEKDNFVECKSHLDRRLLLFFARQISGGFLYIFCWFLSFFFFDGGSF